jgi:hypothetical protein
MKWIGKRISFVDEKKKTTVVIHSDAASWVKTVMGGWVAMWLAIGAIVIWSFSTFDFTGQEKIILVIFLTFWAYYANRVTRSWLWLIWGKELIKIDETSFMYKKSVRKIGKATPYYLENITKLRVSHPEERSLQAAWEKSPWIVGGERMEFDYMGKVIKFGRKLDEKDSKLLFKFLTRKIEDRLRHKN